MDELCIICENEAVALCDAMIGTTWIDGLMSIEGPHFRCDAPMCPEHTFTTGFICGKEPDTIDRCSYHEANPDFGNYADGKEASDIERRRVFASIRRQTFTAVR